MKGRGGTMVMEEERGRAAAAAKQTSSCSGHGGRTEKQHEPKAKLQLAVARQSSRAQLSLNKFGRQCFLFFFCSAQLSSTLV